MLRKEHPTEDWQNCIMLYLDGDELVDTINKVLSTYTQHIFFFFKFSRRQPNVVSKHPLKCGNFVHVCVVICVEMDRNDLVTLMEDDLSSVVASFFYQCNAEDHLKDPKVQLQFWRTLYHTCLCEQNSYCAALLWVHHLYEVLSGQHRTSAGNEFVFRVGTPDSEWRALLGTQLSPQVYRKMPKRLAKR